MNATPGNNPAGHMKASDADRDAVLSDLSEHFQAGRLTAEEFDDRTGRALAARTWGELENLLQDLPASPTGPHIPATAATSAPPQRPLGRTVLVPIAVLAGIGIAVAMSAGTAHARWGIVWLVLPVLLIARRMTCCTGAPRRSSHAPGAPGAASGAATFSSSSFTGASPSRSRACEIAPVVGTTQSCDQPRMNLSPPVSRRLTSS